MNALFRRVFTKRNLAFASGGTVAAAAGGYFYLNSGPAYSLSTKENRRPPPPWTPPSRESMLNALKASGKITQLNSQNSEEEFDLLIVGGGATGAGVAIDAATRGLNVALVDRGDFSSGTSSKSTKLVHGGVRYLQKAIFELDYEQYKLVREALHERKTFLHTAPYLSQALPIMLPVYKYWQVPYYFAGCKLYDILAGGENMEGSYVMTKSKALETFPMLKQDGLVGAVVYHDGQHNDARMNVALIMTAVKHGATVANYCEVTGLHKNAQGRLNGARVKDALTGEEFNVKAKGIVNATGPFSDALLTMDNPEHKPIVQPSSGTHITLPNYYSPRNMGLLDPATSDGRVIFFLPWQGNTIAGTTDSPTEITGNDPEAAEEEIRWVLDEVRRYLSPDLRVRRGDVLSAWSGIRPLVKNPGASSTEGLVRNHMIHVSPGSGLLTIAGGKWTTYRSMAMETVDEAVKVFGLEGKTRNGCITEKIRLVGSDGWSRNMFIGLIQRFGLDTEVAKHLSENYGDRAWTVAALSEQPTEGLPDQGVRLNRHYPFIEAEVRYAIQNEYAVTPTDILARRTRLSFLNARAAHQALPRVADIMASELGWSSSQKSDMIAESEHFLISAMGLDPVLATHATVKDAVKDRVSQIARPVKRVASQLGLFGGAVDGTEGLSSPIAALSRELFSENEIAALKTAFVSAADVVSKGTTGAAEGSNVVEEKKVAKVKLESVLKGGELSGWGYETITGKEISYVLEEAGFRRRDELDFDEFVEVCANLKDVTFGPRLSVSKQLNRRIPVERSGGGT